MRQAEVKYNNETAGLLKQHEDGSFTFTYLDSWFLALDKPAISLSLPKSKKEYTQPFLFACFYNMLPEGANKQQICFATRIDPKDYFGLLMHAAKFDSIGAITIHKQNKDDAN